MERKLQISAYRNIGFEDGKPYTENLILNHSIQKGQMGDLVILIGANNSGKSNVLDALKSYNKRHITDRDITDLYMEEECRKPSLKLSCSTETEKFGCRTFIDGNTFVNYPGSENSDFKIDGSKLICDVVSIISEINIVRNLETKCCQSNFSDFKFIFKSKSII